MGFRIDFERSAEKDLDGLGATAARRILIFLHQRLARLDDPRSLGQALKGPDFAGLWKYRVGDYRIIARIQDQEVVIVVVRIGNRREVYRR